MTGVVIRNDTSTREVATNVPASFKPLADRAPSLHDVQGPGRTRQVLLDRVISLDCDDPVRKRLEENMLAYASGQPPVHQEPY